MVKHKKLGMAVAGACALFGASAANAFGPIKAGDWDLSVGGNVNAFYNYSHCDSNAKSIVGGFACIAPVPAGGTGTTSNVSSVTSGLLPSAIVFSAKTTQEGFDIGVTFGFYPDINIDASQLSDGGINMRQNFLTFGDKEMGTIKMGRDLGLFGSDAIISDFTILGVGAGAGGSAPGNTTLGRIGFGYIYADWIPQITYISTSVSGFQGSIGIFQPLIAKSVPFGGGAGATLTGHSMPSVQGKLTYDYDVSGVSGRAWTGLVYQRSTAISGDSLAASNLGVAGYAGEVGVKAAYAGWDGVVYYYQGRGVGSTALFTGGFSAAGNKRNSDGGYAQLAYRMGKWKPGISYGVSRLKLASSEINGTLLQTNRAAIAQLQYSLTKALTLVGEYGYIKSKNQLGAANTQGAYSLGAILFF